MAFSFVSALCEDEQIDINIASAEELDKLIGIGPVKAQAIIDTRPFDSIDSLIDVYGIGEVTLTNIKEQGLACVEVEIVEEEIVEEVIEEISDDGVLSSTLGDTSEGKEKEEEFEIITLTTQTIKSPDNKENKSNYALYGFVGFCFLLGILFILRRKKYKNEFR